MATSTRRPTRAPKLRDPLSQLLASGALRAVVLYFATHEEDEPSVRALVRATGLGPASAEAEVARLTRLGVLERRPRGREVRLALQIRHPLWIALRALVRAAAVAPDVIRAAFSDLDGIEEAFIFGSTVAGTARADSDVDVVVVGAPAERLFARRTLDASALLGREVNPILLSPAEWVKKRAAKRGFWNEVAQEPKEWIVQRGALVRPNAAHRQHEPAA